MDESVVRRAGTRGVAGVGRVLPGPCVLDRDACEDLVVVQHQHRAAQRVERGIGGVRGEKEGLLRPRRGAASEERVAEVLTVDGREPRGLCRCILDRMAGERSERRPPVCEMRDPCVRGAAALGRHDATTDRGGNAKAALPVRKLAAAVRVVVASIWTMRPAVVARPDHQAVLPHALSVQQTDNLPDHCVHSGDHGIVDPPNSDFRHGVRLHVLLRDLQWLVVVGERQVQEEGRRRIVLLDNLDSTISIDVHRVVGSVQTYRRAVVEPEVGELLAAVHVPVIRLGPVVLCSVEVCQGAVEAAVDGEIPGP
mmetsp:Transcript_34068/g.68781  ORF Transcript_34068/g.68781 Transcript_34068/m.68781 type:complete len:310 (+) Transcript_34068:396-1325(+)